MSAGFGYINKNISKQYAITVSDDIDYEISFWFKQPTRDATFEVSVKCFDCDLITELKTIDVRSGAFNNVLLPGNVPICSLENKWNFWHGCVYNKNQPVVSSKQPFTSHAAGTNVIMRAGTRKIFVNVICVKNCMLIWDFKFKPMLTPFSTGFLNSNGLIEIWRKNNKKDLTEDQIQAIANRYLLGYDASLSVINI